LLEVSRCASSWSAGCIIATNYHYPNDNLKPFSNITIPYNGSEQILYFRLKADLSEVAIAIHVSYVDDAPLTTGQFVSTIFNSIVPGSQWMYFSQMVKNEETATVANEESALFYINFCAAAIRSDYTVTVTVTGELTTPLAAFDVAACSANAVTLEQCQVYNGGLPGVAAKQLTISTIFVQLESSEISMTEGIYVNVYGWGGEVDGLNDFVLSIVEAPSS